MQDLVEKGLGKNWMTDFFEKIKKQPKIENQLEIFVRNYPDGNYKIQSKKGQNVLIQKRFDEKTKECLGETIEYTVKEVEFKGNTITISIEKKKNFEWRELERKMKQIEIC